MNEPEPGPEPAIEPRGVVRPLSVAPMMDRTDRHFRVLVRQFTRRSLLYSEMITTGAIIHGDRERLLDFSALEHPIPLQLGGDDPVELARCAETAMEWGYDEVNLNVGCPSDRVRDGAFGACLMAKPEGVAACVRAMRDAVPLPVTVKHRIGIDDLDRYEDMRNFVEVVAAAGCDRFSVHARKAVLGGLSPKQNRQIPPLRYDDVYRLKRELPHLVIELNGGVLDLDATVRHLAEVDAVMIGRAAYDNPEMLGAVDALLFGEPESQTSGHDAVRAMLPYIDDWLAAGGRLHDVTRHLLGLFAGRPGARQWRRYISENAPLPGAGVEVVQQALERVPLADAA